MADLRTRLFQAWFRVSRPMTLGARAVVENKQGEVLLVRHTYVSGLYLPGGGVEHGETVFDSMRRELEEEGGVRLTGTAELIGIFSNHPAMRNDHVVLYRVPASAWEPCGDPIGREISELVWCDPTAPPGDATPGTIRRLKALYDEPSASLFW